MLGVTGPIGPVSFCVSVEACLKLLFWAGIFEILAKILATVQLPYGPL